MILNCYLLLKQHGKHLVKTDEKHFKICIVDGLYPPNHDILKNYPVFFSENKNNVQQTSNKSTSNGIVIHSPSQRFTVGSMKKVQKPLHQY